MARKSAIAEAHDVLNHAEGSPFEMRELRCFEKTLTARTVLSYVHAPQSYREIWIEVARQFATAENDREYVAFYGNSTNDLDAPRRAISYSESNRMITSLANILYDNFHVRKGTRVGIASRNSIEFVLVWCKFASGSTRSGALLLTDSRGGHAKTGYLDSTMTMDDDRGLSYDRRWGQSAVVDASRTFV
jgi:hypothetical protein